MILALGQSNIVVLSCGNCWCGPPLTSESLTIYKQGSLSRLKKEIPSLISEGYSYDAGDNCRHLKGVTLKKKSPVPFWDAVDKG